MTSTPKPLDNVSTEASSEEEDGEHQLLNTPGHSKSTEANSEEEDGEHQPLNTPRHSKSTEANSEEEDGEHQPLTTPGHSKSTEASSKEEEGEYQALTTPGYSKPLVSMEASSGAMICPESKREKSIAKDDDKNVCPRGICIMKRPNLPPWQKR